MTRELTITALAKALWLEADRVAALEHHVQLLCTTVLLPANQGETVGQLAEVCKVQIAAIQRLMDGDTKPRRSIVKQEALVSELHRLLREHTPEALAEAHRRHEAVWISGDGQYAHENRATVLSEVLQNIMKLFGYVVTDIQ